MVFTSICFDELFSARVSGHRAQRLALNAQPGKELIVIPTLSLSTHILRGDAHVIVRVLTRTKVWPYLTEAEVAL